MKKPLSIIFIAIITVCLTLSFCACKDDNGDELGDVCNEQGDFIYKYVVLIGVDGMGRFCKQTDTPNIDRIFADGATTDSMQSVFPSISAENWTSMLHCVTPEVHGITNDIASTKRFDSQNGVPSIMKILKEQRVDSKVYSFCTWAAINYGIIENDVGVKKYDTLNDVLSIAMIPTKLDISVPDLLYIQFDSVDHQGHTTGYGSEEYLEQISIVDGYIGRIYDKYEELGLLENTLFIVTADHGGTMQRCHGEDSPEEMNVFCGICGKTVKKGTIGTSDVRDISCIIAKAMGLEEPEAWSGKLPDGVFYMNKKYVFFDLDGTITDPKIGITKGVNEGLKRFSKQETDLNKLTKFIGPPLRASFKEFYNMTDEEAENAVSAYREYYKDIGIFEATVYDGLKELLDRLISSGLTLIVATSKPTIFAKRVIDHFGLSERFEEIIGCELTSVKDDKAVIIKEALEKCNANPSDVVMVGDRKFDILSAHQNGVKCISVTYGYGSQTEFLENKTDAIVDDFITLEHKIYEFLNV